MKKIIMAWVVATLFAGTASAALVKTFTSQALTSSIMTNDYNAVSVQEGDVVVMTVADNKTYSATPISFSSTAGALTLVDTRALNPYPTSYTAYQAIETTGSYDFSVMAGAALWGRSGLYILRADSGAIDFLASAEFINLDGNSEVDQTLSYNWGGSDVTGGIVIEAVGARTSTVTPLDVDVVNDSAATRNLCSATFSGTSFSSTYSFAGGTAGITTSSGVGLIFAENVWTGGNRAPEFDNDPVVKPDAVMDAPYSGTLADDAHDADGDPITFSKLSATPAWLSVASNGDLSGTPLSSDLGTNSWTVQVVDDQGGTNSATLQINVAASEFYAIPLTSTNIYVQGAQFVNMDGNGMNFHRFDAGILSGATAVNLNPVKAKTTTGAKLSFYTRSDTVNLYFDYIPGDENRNSRFGIYQDGTQVDTPYISNTETSAVINLTSLAAPGELVRHDVVLPNWFNPILTQLELKVNTELEADNPYPQKKMIVLGDSISHGTGQGASYLTYPYIAADMMDMELFNMAVGGAKIAPEVADLLQYFDPVDAIWVLAGYNNWQGGSESIASITNSYETLLATVRAHQPDAEVFCSTLTYTTNTEDLESGVTAVEVHQGVSDVVNARIAAGDTRLHLVDGLSISTSGDLNDAVHFSEEGAANVATNVVAIMDPIINPVPPTPQNGTNILFIAIDDMNPILGCYGNMQIISPHMDSLAASGVTFLNAHCQWSVCGPSRASLSAGLMPEETGVLGFRKMRGDAVNPDRVNTVVRPNVVTLQQYFRYNGYRTAATGKINDYRCVGTLDTVTGKVAEDGAVVDDPPSWGDPVDPNNLPTDFFSNSAYVQATAGVSGDGNSTTAIDQPDSDFTDGKICSEGITLMQSLAAGDTQFFLGVGFKKPHLAFIAPQQYWDYYQRDDFSIAPFQDHPLHEVSYTWNYAKELRGYPDIPTDPEVPIPEVKQLELIHGYYACISFIDAQVGRLLDELETLGLHTNTIVVLWGDHGFHLGDHEEWAKHTNLEQATHVPLIIHNPFSGQSGAKSETPVALMDLYPTLCEMAGLPLPQQPLAQNEDPFDPAAGRS
ncbi:MAG: sulfatase-like hydrolase/transferase, partial [Verrucomicrobia bacterium]|nr:sulfatase-like hydrolase/transferase [Verrucomicrobiota bacterium]